MTQDVEALSPELQAIVERHHEVASEVLWLEAAQLDERNPADRSTAFHNLFAQAFAKFERDLRKGFDSQGSDENKLLSYEWAHEDAVSMGYPSLTEGLEDLDRLRLAALSPSPLVREALEGYRAAVSWVAADSWDGCSDCIEWLKAASAADWAREPMSPDELATALARLRPHKPFSHPPTVAAQAPHSGNGFAFGHGQDAGIAAQAPHDGTSAFDKRLQELTDEAIHESLATIEKEFQRRFNSTPHGEDAVAAEQTDAEAFARIKETIANPPPPSAALVDMFRRSTTPAPATVSKTEIVQPLAIEAEARVKVLDYRVRRLEAALRVTRGWVITCSESAQAKRDLKTLDAALASSTNGAVE